MIAVQNLAWPAYILALLGQNVDPPHLSMSYKYLFAMHNLIKETSYVVAINNYSMLLSVLGLLAIFLISHSIMPDSTPNSNNKVCHNTGIIRSMPVGSSSRSPDHIASLQMSWDTSLIADPAITGDNFDHLALLVGVPMCSGTRCKCDIGNRCVCVHVDRIQEDVTAKVSVGFIHLALGLKPFSMTRELGIIASLGFASKKKVSPWMTFTAQPGNTYLQCLLVVYRELLLEQRLGSLLYIVFVLKWTTYPTTSTPEVSSLPRYWDPCVRKGQLAPHMDP